LIDSNNKLYGIFSFFSPLYLELSLGCRIIDNFSDYFSFNLATRNKNNKICFQQLDNIVLKLSSFSSSAIIIMDASIKNNIVTSILHMHIANCSIIKTLYYMAFATETKLFMIRCSINQICTKKNISKIIVVTDSIHVAKKIFNTLLYSY